MRVISIKRIKQFVEKYPQSESSLLAWYAIAKKAHWRHFADLKKDFNAADVYERRTIFDISGNHFRLIARVNYHTERVFILHILTHKQYDKGDWKKL
jgi:mRNA interferase HigB